MDEWLPAAWGLPRLRRPYVLTILIAGQQGVYCFGLLVSSSQRIHSLIDEHMLRSSACLLSLRPLGLVPASGLLWLLSKSPKLILIDGATLVTAPKKGPSAGTSVRHMLQMPLLVADQQVVNGCWSGDQQR